MKKEGKGDLRKELEERSEKEDKIVFEKKEGKNMTNRKQKVLRKREKTKI